MRWLLLSILALPLAAQYSVVQYINCDNSTSPLTCVMPGDVTAGNFLVVMTAKRGGDTCDVPAYTTFSDTIGSTFLYAWAEENENTAQSNSCVKYARIGTSGPDTITRTEGVADPANYPAAMWVVEITGGPPTITIHNSDQCDARCVTLNTGNVTTVASFALLACVSADYFGTAYDSVLPAGGAYYVWTDAGGTGSFLVKPVTAGTYSCTFGKTLGGVRLSAVAVLFAPATGVRHRVPQ